MALRPLALFDLARFRPAQDPTKNDPSTGSNSDRKSPNGILPPPRDPPSPCQTPQPLSPSGQKPTLDPEPCHARPPDLGPWTPSLPPLAARRAQAPRLPAPRTPPPDPADCHRALDHGTWLTLGHRAGRLPPCCAPPQSLHATAPAEKRTWVPGRVWASSCVLIRAFQALARWPLWVPSLCWERAATSGWPALRRNRSRQLPPPPQVPPVLAALPYGHAVAIRSCPAQSPLPCPPAPSSSKSQAKSNTQAC